MNLLEYYKGYEWSATDEEPVVGAKLINRYIELLDQKGHDLKTYLDVGCGDGYQARLIRERFGIHTVIGAEISDFLICKARRNLDCVVQSNIDGEILPFQDNQFDLVTIFHVLEHIFYLDKTIKELHRVLKPGGTLLIDVPNSAYWINRILMLFGFPIIWIGLGKHIRAFNAVNLRQLVKKAGFTEQKIYGSFIPLPKTRFSIPLIHHICPNMSLTVLSKSKK